MPSPIQVPNHREEPGVGVLHCDIGGSRLTLDIAAIGLRKHPVFQCYELVLNCATFDTAEFTFTAAISEQHIRAAFRGLAPGAASA